MMIGSFVCPRTIAGATPLPTAARAPVPATFKNLRLVKAPRRLTMRSSPLRSKGHHRQHQDDAALRAKQNGGGGLEHRSGPASEGSGKIRRDMAFDCREPISISSVG